MPNCQQNILDIPFSPSLPADTDVVIFTLQDGSSVIRYWSAIKDALIAGIFTLDDLPLTVGGAGANDPANEATVVTLPAEWANKRIQVFRNGSYFRGWSRTAGGLALTQTGDKLMQDETLDIVDKSI